MILLSLPLFSVGINLYRLPNIIDRDGAQTFRTLMASLDMLVATITVNAVVLSSLVQDKGYKKLKYKHARDVMDPFTGRGVTKVQTNKSRQGSDEDLMQYDDVEMGTGLGEIEMEGLRKPEQVKFPAMEVFDLKSAND